MKLSADQKAQAFILSSVAIFAVASLYKTAFCAFGLVQWSLLGGEPLGIALEVGLTVALISLLSMLPAYFRARKRIGEQGDFMNYGLSAEARG